jgi:RNA polymerase sigma-70 factor (ECF subfamily)
MYRESTNVVRLRPGGASEPGMQADPDRYIGTRETPNLDKQTKSRRFEEIFVTHLDAAYDLARWLTRDEHNAEDMVQEACLRAYRFIESFHGENGRAWLLAIVRNTYYSWLEKNRSQALNVPFDEEALDDNGGASCTMEHDASFSVDRVLQQEDSRRVINTALGQLPPEFREVIVLREMEDMSYKEIAVIANIPLGTVMSRLARARKMLLRSLQQLDQES